MSILNTSQIKIIEEIFRKPGINVREIIVKTRLSPNYVLKYVNMFVERGIVKEERFEKKRVYLRRFFFNLKSNLANNLFSLFIEEKKEGLYKKYPILKPVFNQLLSVVSNIDFIVLYGSYARLAAEKDSDLDIIIVGKIKNKDRIREIFVTLPLEVSIKTESLEEFNKRILEPLHQQILKEGILIYDSEKYLKVLSKTIPQWIGR